MTSTYAIYLRKSRKDLDAEALGQTDTLKKHRETLLALASTQHLNISHIYEEVVSGDSIAARPEMQKLLSVVETGALAGVLCMEVERLARGDTIDQGIVAQTFKYSDTKIITPMKTYDPGNEFDEEYFEFGLFMSRREYKTINRRLQRGRIASMKEGKYVAHKVPYGYTRQPVPGDKGFYLVPEPTQAPVIRDMFSWYTGSERMGVSKIVRLLNELNIPTVKGGDWTPCVVREILSNPVYAGWLRWGYRGTVKSMTDGELSLSNPRNDDCQLFKGLHEPLISQAQYDTAQFLLANNKSRPGPKQVKMRNPLSGLIRCEGCGRAMVLRPNGEQAPWIMCPYTSCHATVSAKLTIVEDAVLSGLRSWLLELDLGEDQRTEEDRSPMIEKLLEASEAQQKSLLQREQKAYDLVETGVYSADIFLQRMAAIRDEREKLSVQIDAYKSELSRIHAEQSARRDLAPSIRHVLQSYPLTEDPEEKNALLRTVLDHAEYHKTIRERWGQEDLRLTLYPNLSSPYLSPIVTR